ncbi:MAG: hypothetical protein QOE63_1018 [Acidimicrobiaceae bacterium]
MVAPTRPPPVTVPIPLRPMTATDIIDGGIEAVKTAPRAVLLVSAAFVIPAQLLVLAIVQGRPAGMGAAGIIRSFTDGFGSSSVRVVDVAAPLVIHSIALVLLAATTAELVVSWYYRRPTTAGAAIAATLRRTPALLALWAMVHVFEAVATLALVVPGVLVAALCSVAVPVLVVEHVGPFAAVDRSWRLTRTRFGSVLWVVILIAVVDLVLATALGGVGFLVTPFDFAPAVSGVVVSAASVVTAPFVAAATTLLYLDLRVRAEGLDIELGIAERMHAG